MAASSITPALLEALLSADANIRSQAETVFHSVNTTERIQGLLTVLSQVDANANNPVGLLTAVLLRRDIVKLDSYQLLMDLAQPLLQAFQANVFPLQVGHCLAEVCASLTLVQPKDQPTLVTTTLTTILSTLQTSFQQGFLPSLQLLAALAEKAPIAFTQLATDSLPSLYTSGWSAAAVQAWAEVLVNAGVASTIKTVSIVGGTAGPANLDDLIVDPSSKAAQLAPALLPVLEFVASSTAAHESNLQAILQHLSHATTTCPSLVAANPQVLQATIQACLQVASASVTDSPSLALASLQVLASLVSVGDIKRKYLSNEQASAIAKTSLPIAAQIMANHLRDAEEDQEWAQEPASLVQDGMDDDDEADEFLFATMLVESFLGHLGALPVMLPLAESLLQSPGKERAGLTLLDCALAATPFSLSPHLPVVLQAATAMASSPTSTPSTQRQALRLLGGLCETHSEWVLAEQSDAASRILGCLVQGLTSPFSKISVTASLAIVSYCRGNGAPDHSEHLASSLAAHRSALLTALLQGPLAVTGTDPGSVAVRVRAMGATACLAEASGEDFAAYYSTLLPGLVASAQLPSVELASASLEAATIVGQAVGKDVFQTDSIQLLAWIVPALQGESPLLESLLLACARIASVLEEDFAPYAGAVLPILLARVQEDPELSVMEGNENGLNTNLANGSGTESLTVALPGRGFTTVSINTTKIQEKAQATRAVYELAKAMGASFGPYAAACFETFLPLVNFPYSADVRSTAAQTLGAVLEASCIAGENTNMSLPQKYLPLLAKAISTQVAAEDTADMEALYALSDSLSEVYYIVYRYRNSHPEILANFPIQNAQASVEACMKTMIACLERRAQITRVLQGALTGEDEQEEYLSQLAAQEQLLTPLVDSVGYTLKFFRAAFLPIFDQQIVPVLGPKLADQSDVRASISAICLFDDVVEHCGTDAASKYAAPLVQGIVTAFEKHSSEKELIQAAVYGVAQVARYGPSQSLSPHLTTIVQRLLALTIRPKEEANGEEYLVEIAASALASLTLLGPFPDLKFAPRTTLVHHFLSQLPILQDDDEAKICHAGLCHLVESGGVVLDQEASHLTRIIGEILTEVQNEEDVATPDTVERLSSILFQLQQTLPSSSMQQILGGLVPEAQAVVGNVLQEVARSRTHVVTP